MRPVVGDVGRRALPEPTVEPSDGAKVEFSVGVSADPARGPRITGIPGGMSCSRCGVSGCVLHYLDPTTGEIEGRTEDISDEDLTDHEEDGEENFFDESCGSGMAAGASEEVDSEGKAQGTYFDLSPNFHLENMERIDLYLYRKSIGAYRINGGSHKCFTTFANFARYGELRCVFDEPHCGELINTCSDCDKIISKKDRRCKACRRS